jgi:hypothetical protein
MKSCWPLTGVEALRALPTRNWPRLQIFFAGQMKNPFSGLPERASLAADLVEEATHAGRIA